MGLRSYANAPATTLVGPVSNVGTNLTLDSVVGLPLTYPYTLILDRGQATEEVVEVTGAAGTVLTVVRGVDSTTAFSHAAGAEVVHGISARDIREANAHVNADSDVHGITGALAGVTQVQTLTNKTMDVDANNIRGMGSSAVVTTNSSGSLDAGSNIPKTAFAPVGALVPFAGASAPSGWLMCNGAAVSRAVYSSLFAVIGTSYGAGDGSTTFNLPDLRDRAPVGASGSKVLATASGAASVTLSQANMPAHSHSIDHDHPAVGTSGDSHSHTLNYEYFPNTQTVSGGSIRVTDIGNQTGGTGTNVNATTSSDSHSHTVDIPYFAGSSGSAGSGSAFSVQNPYVALNYLIRAV